MLWNNTKKYKRKIRVERAFGEEYSMEKIRNRIYRNTIRKNKNIPWVKSLEGKYFSRKGIEKSVPVIKNEIKELEDRENKQKELAKNKKKERRWER